VCADVRSTRWIVHVSGHPNSQNSGSSENAVAINRARFTLGTSLGIRFLAKFKNGSSGLRDSVCDLPQLCASYGRMLREQHGS